MTSSFDRSIAAAASPKGSAGWAATQLQTQMQSAARPGSNDEAPDEERDIGRAVGDGTRELFVTCEPADALVQQFDHLQPEYALVHDMGVAASRKLLAGIAAASRRSVQRLVVRRNGAGTVLASIEFVDCPASNGRSVRLYSSEIEADTTTRQAMARVLLSHSRLGVVMVGDLPAHALASALAPWREAVLRGGWLCRRMLFMPLAAGAALPGEVAKFRISTSIDATAAPQVSRPAEVWAQMCAAWNQLQQQGKPGQNPASLPLLGTPSAAAAASAASAAATPPTPMPIIGAPTPPRDALLERYLHDLSELAGVVSVCAFDILTGGPVGHAGARPGPDEMARHGSSLLTSMMAGSRALGLGATVPEATLTLGQHHLLLRPVPGHPGMALHVLLDKPHVTLALILLQLRRLEDALLTSMRGETGRAPATRY